MALGEVPDDALAALVHDAARPLVDDDVLERVLPPLAEGVDGVVPALPLADTVKRVEGDHVAETLDRGALVAAQTPQAFSRRRSARAYAGDLRSATDCASLVERAGRPHPRRPGRSRLLKVTTRGDLALVESWLAMKAVFFDVGETLVDEERYWREVARAAGLGPHVIWAALGVTIARGEEHFGLWRHLGIERPTPGTRSCTRVDDLYPDAVDCLESVRAMGLLVGLAGNQNGALESWARSAELAGRRRHRLGQPRRAQARPRLLRGHRRGSAGCDGGRGRVRRRSRRQRRSAGGGSRSRRDPRPARALGAAAADAAGGGARGRRSRVAPRGV